MRLRHELRESHLVPRIGLQLTKRFQRRPSVVCIAELAVGGWWWRTEDLLGCLIHLGVHKKVVLLNIIVHTRVLVIGIVVHAEFN